eukprot:CCRYP_012121-RA/>CCRYP_012121-RA protein AED:0.18 eAED:0.18 QI:0/-1/0/1/-1/1/1/0/443
MKNSPHTEDDYMFSIPVDDPVEHSVRILMELNDETASSSTDEDKSSLKATFNNPEDDAKRILNDLLASENLRTTASRIASGVIQSPPFQNACKVLVRNIWDDLVSDPETNNQLVALVQSVLQNERIYRVMKEMLIKLVNDEEVYKELTKLVVQLGEERDVLDATQRLLTESAHKTLNDPSVLDHSMEFATEVVGDDVVQRSGGEALRNTLGYAVQPSGGAIIAGLGTMLVAGAIHFYFLRGSNIDDGFTSPRSSFNSLVSGGDSGTRNAKLTSSIGGDNVISTIFLSTWVALSTVLSFPVLFVGSICNGISNVFSYPRRAILYGSEKCHHCAKYISTIPSNVGSKIISLPSWLGTSAKSSVTSVCSFASRSLTDFQSGVMNCCRSSMEYIISISKTTKGALTHIVATSRTSIAYCAESLTSLLASLRNRWTGTGAVDSTHTLR